MFSINKVSNIMTMCRGDSVKFPFEIHKGDIFSDEVYVPTQYDTIYFGIMEYNKRFEDSIVKKLYTINSDTDEKGNILITLDPTDTQYLHPGKYFYCVKLKTIDPETLETVSVQTLRKDTEFILL